MLIYRYFGGLEGLLAAWAKDNDFYTLAYQAYSERVTKAESSEDIIKLTQTVLLKQLNFLRTNKLMQELLAWELSGNSTFRSIQDERERNGFKLQEELEKKLGKESKDVRMFITILFRRRSRSASNHSVSAVTCRFVRFIRSIPMTVFLQRNNPVFREYKGIYGRNISLLLPMHSIWPCRGWPH